MLPRTIDIYRVLPEMVWCCFGVLVMLMQPFVRSRHFFTFLALIGALAGTAASVTSAMHAGPGFDGLVQSDSFSFFFRLLVGTVAFLVVLVAEPYLERERLPFAEFYALLLFATAGMGVLASAQELLTAFIGLEMSSISSYILAGYRRDSLKSSESAMKYFLLGSFATAFFLYGIALVYGATGTTQLGKMAEADVAAGGTLLKLGLAMILIGLGFKVAAAPFQVWTPDVYEGAPTPVTALFSAGPKAAAFALLLRIFATVPAATHFWFWAFWGLAALTMFAGNLGALVQTNVKRLLAYSSIAHAGYILVAFAAVTFMGRGGSAGGTPPPPPRGLFFGGFGGVSFQGGGWIGESSARLCRGAFLFAQLRAGKAGGVHDRFAAGRHRRKTSFPGRLRGPFPAAAVRVGRAERLPAFAPWVAGYGGGFLGGFHLSVGGEISPSLARPACV